MIKHVEKSWFAIAVICASCTAMLPGCSKSGTQEVSGVVMFDGSPLAEGQIEFIPIKPTRGPTAGAAIQNGEFEVPAVANGLIVGGVYKVSISAMVGSGKFTRNPVAPGGKSETLKELLPPRYNEKSELQITVSANADENKHDFQLKSS